MVFRETDGFKSTDSHELKMMKNEQAHNTTSCSSSSSVLGESPTPVAEPKTPLLGGSVGRTRLGRRTPDRSSPPHRVHRPAFTALHTRVAVTRPCRPCGQLCKRDTPVGHPDSCRGVAWRAVPWGCQAALPVRPRPGFPAQPSAQGPRGPAHPALLLSQLLFCRRAGFKLCV